MSRILYIGGCTRSGSTLVDRMLGQLPGFVSTGELGLITTHSITENRLCGCGRRFRECPYWHAVGEAAFGGWDGADAAELVTLHPQVTRQRYIPLLVFPSLSPGFARRLRRYQSLLARLYAAINSVSGAEIVVDSTKAPAYALVLRGIPGVDLRILDLVRDSRGTAYSSSKQQVMKDSVDRVVPKHRYAAPIITMRWIVYHLIFDCIRIAGLPGITVRYEDVVRSPQQLLRQIAAFAGRPVCDHDLDFILPPTVHMREDHTAVGNDSRLDQGTITLREDDAWRTKLPAQSRKLVTVMSWPLLKRWRYV
jgi:Sulfotransferase family